MFGRNCQESCKAENGCQGQTFCLVEPYGCSCASGWHGHHCNKRRFDGLIHLVMTTGEILATVSDCGSELDGNLENSNPRKQEFSHSG